MNITRSRRTVTRLDDETIVNVHSRAASSTAEQRTFNPLVPGSNPGRLTEARTSAFRAKTPEGGRAPSSPSAAITWLPAERARRTRGFFWLSRILGGRP